MLRLRVHLAGGSREFPLEDASVTLGRGSSNTVVIEGEALVSREHCRVERQGDHWVLLDLGSQNGTRLGAGRIEPHVPVPLRSGMRFFVGRVRVDVLGEPLLGRLAGLLGLGALLKRRRAAAPTAPPGTMKCPRCGALVNVAKRPRGSEVGCPRCRSVFRAP